MKIVRQLSPIDSMLRKAHKLQRRVYHNKVSKLYMCYDGFCVQGPNYLWHVDGYDKLKPYGFCIHGCIDG